MRTVAKLIVASCVAFTCCASVAQTPKDYPTRPIRVILTIAPGGGSDITARAIAQKLTEAWGQQIIIDNRPGGNGIVGMAIGANATPDGYTLVHGTIGPVAVTPSFYAKLPYDPVKDFAAVARGVSALNVLVVHPSLPVHAVKDLVAYAKANPAKLNFGSSGVGAADHLAGELFNNMAGVKMSHVPYKGGAPAMIDLVGGNLQLIFATMSTALTQIKANRIRAVAVTSAKRIEQFPELPTVSESGLPGFVVDNWYGTLAPRGTPKAIVNRLHAEINRALGMNDVKERLALVGIYPFTAPTPEAFGDYIKSEVAKYAQLVKSAGLKSD